MIFLWIMRRWKARFSNTPTYGMILVGLICGAIFGFLFELGCIIVGQFWGTFGATAKYSILPDSWQRFSIIECCIMGNIPGWIAISLYFVNDKGETFVERGVDKLKISHSSKGVLRFFAVLALVQMVMFLNYTVPFTTFGLHADKYPADIPVHILNKSCGEGSDYHCPEPGLPIMTKGPGAYIITPDKKLIQK